MPLTTHVLDASSVGPGPSFSPPWTRKLDARLLHFWSMGEAALVELLQLDRMAVADRARTVRHLRLPLADHDGPDTARCRPAAAFTAGLHQVHDEAEEATQVLFDVFVRVEDGVPHFPALVTVDDAGASIVLARLSRAELESVAALAVVSRIELARPVTPMMSAAGAAADLLAPVSQPPGRVVPRLANVVLGIVDTRFDLLHPDLCWRVATDQGWPEYRQGPTGHRSKVRAHLDLHTGQVVPVSGIDRELERWNHRASGHSPGPDRGPRLGRFAELADGSIDDHGTVSACVAAGVGNAYASPGPGRAPGAELLLAALQSSDGHAVPTTADIVRAVDWMRSQVDDDEALVVSISMATPFGPRDGSSLDVRCLDLLARKANPGDAARAIVLPAGNDNLAGRHVRTGFRAGTGVPLSWQVSVRTARPPAQELRPTTPDGLQVFVGGAQCAAAWLHLPHGAGTLEMRPDYRGVVLLTRGPHPVATLYWDNRRASGAGSHAVLELAWVQHEGRHLPPGTWRLDLRPIGAPDGIVDAWLGVNDIECVQWLDPAPTQHEQTLSDLATGFRTFAVGNAATTPVQPCATPSPHPGPAGAWLCSSSGCGPTADGRDKPDYAAPGTLVEVPCARSRDVLAQPATELARLATGTSLSAPYVAGLIARFLSANPRTTHASIRSHLDVLADDDNLANQYSWGNGLLRD